MENLKPREIFLNACADIANQLQEYGFKATQKGQTLKRTSADKDMTFEISFQSSHYNYSASIEICPHIYIYSKQFAKSMQDSTDGLIFGVAMSNISPKNKYFRNLAGLSYSSTVNEILQELKTYALPIFELFENDNKEKAVEFLKNKKVFFNKFTEKYIEMTNQYAKK